MNGRYVLSPLAKEDIDRIWDYTAQCWGARQAEFYIRELKQHIETIAAQPGMGCACSEVRSGYYKYP